MIKAKRDGKRDNFSAPFISRAPIALKSGMLIFVGNVEIPARSESTVVIKIPSKIAPFILNTTKIAVISIPDAEIIVEIFEKLLKKTSKKSDK